MSCWWVYLHGITYRTIAAMRRIKYSKTHIYIYMYAGWWFQPLWKILVSWDHYSQCMENRKCSKPPTSMWSLLLLLLSTLFLLILVAFVRIYNCKRPRMLSRCSHKTVYAVLLITRYCIDFLRPLDFSRVYRITPSKPNRQATETQWKPSKNWKPTKSFNILRANSVF